METTSMRPVPRNLKAPRRIDWDAALTWVFCFGLVVLLGLEGGGYDPLVHDQVGIAIWWAVGLGALLGALPRLGPGRLALVALALFAALAGWMALSLIWTESSERTLGDLARMLLYLGAFAMVLLLRAPREPQRLISALAAAIALVGLIALLSRLHPAWFSAADQTALFLADSRERLSYPLNYWNGLAALIAIGLPLLLHVSASARTVFVRALAAASMPALALALFFTLSRGGIAAAALAVLVFLLFTGDRLPKILTLLVAGAGGAVLIVLSLQRDALRQGLNTDAAHSEGNEILLVTVALCLAAGVVHGLVSKVLIEGGRPRWTVPGRRQSLAGLLTLVVAVAVVAAAADAPGRFANAVDEFKGGGGAGSGAARLNSFAGESRYDLWVSAVDQNATEPLLGTGSGTFAYWWTRDAAGEEAVQDAHSLYLQTLGELGIVGFVLIVGFLGLVLGAGAYRTIRARDPGRSQLAAALAGCVAFCLTAAVDWSWQIPVLVLAMLILAAALVAAEDPWEPVAELARRLPVRIGIAAVAIGAVIVVAIPLASTSLVRESEAAARRGDLDAALADARSAQNVNPAAAAPRLQQALVLEIQGRFGAAVEAARAAVEREPTNWRTWLVLSRVEALSGNVDAALSSYREARRLNPLSPLFTD